MELNRNRFPSGFFESRWNFIYVQTENLQRKVTIRALTVVVVFLRTYDSLSRKGAHT